MQVRRGDNEERKIDKERWGDRFMDKPKEKRESKGKGQIILPFHF